MCIGYQLQKHPKGSKVSWGHGQCEPRRSEHFTGRILEVGCPASDLLLQPKAVFPLRCCLFQMFTGKPARLMLFHKGSKLVVRSHGLASWRICLARAHVSGVMPEFGETGKRRPVQSRFDEWRNFNPTTRQYDFGISGGSLQSYQTKLMHARRNSRR